MNTFKKAPVTFVYKSHIFKPLPNPIILVYVPNNRNYVLTRKCIELN